jgi:hypothetical protein
MGSGGWAAGGGVFRQSRARSVRERQDLHRGGRRRARLSWRLGSGVTGSTEPARAAVFDREGNLYISDSLNHRIRKIGANGFISTVAGSGVRGFYGDGGLATQAQLNSPQGVAVDSLGNIYFADTGNHVVRRVSPEGVLSTVAGTGFRGYSGDGGKAALSALPNSRQGVAVDAEDYF